MIELKGLEDWARGILATPISTLNRRFGSWKKQEELRKAIEELPFFSRYRPVFRQISAPTLLELHQKLRGQKCEPWVWVAVLKVLDHPLPDEVALDLVGRDIAISWLGHSPQSEQVLWKLAPLVDEALLTIVKRIYTDSSRSLEELQNVLRDFPQHEWMLDSLAHCSASSTEKRDAFEKAVENHPKRDWLIETNPRVDSEQAPFVYFDWSNLPNLDLMKALYGGYNFEQLLEMGRDDQTPDEILRELELLPGSREVRFNARHNLRRREEARQTE